MTTELPTRFDHREIESQIFQRWLTADAFAAVPDEREQRYVIMMPLPNVTGALHMGHAMDNVMQDLLVRWRRMAGDNTLWMPGTDHAGIATQAVVEKRLFELEGKTRHDLGREALVERIWQWKDQYQQRIVKQLQEMGCSCDWRRQRFTMDAVCAAAVHQAFFSLFGDRLIYRGNRLVNWDCHLQTAVSDDEIIYKEVEGFFWHLRYPVIDPKPGEPEHVVVATTRPETMLGDTAVACHPDPEGAIRSKTEHLQERLAEASAKDRTDLEDELQRLEERKSSHLPLLLKLAEMARDGRMVRLPLQDRPIPLILDEWAKPELGSGCVKITPAHDPNDYEVWQRHPEIGAVNILCSDGTLSENTGAYSGLDRFVGREQVVKDLTGLDLIEAIEEHTVEIGHSDRSKTPIEPYLSKQWFVRMGDQEGGIVCGRGTGKEHRASGLAQAAIDAAGGEWRSPSGLNLTFHPDPERYRATYTSWLAEKRDWCISRQLWWGHRIPVWHALVEDSEALSRIVSRLPTGDGVNAWIADATGLQHDLEAGLAMAGESAGAVEVQVCLRDQAAEEQYAEQLEELGLVQDPDVLDTWFSSALWPFSTLGWPDPEQARIDEGQRSLCASDGHGDALSYFYPGSCLVTSRDIITLWVARMQMMGLYIHGDVPFYDCFIHAKIMDGKGETMSKSKGNGVDPVDIIEQYGADAMRYVLCDMQTGTQDIRMAVQAVCPAYDPKTHKQDKVELAEAEHGQTIFTFLCPECGQEFDVLGTMENLPAAKIISDRFDMGRNFCTKLWNAARFTLMNLGEPTWQPLAEDELAGEDRWLLSRLNLVIAELTRELGEYNPSAAIGLARDFFWGELCDWYLEMIKSRLKAGGRQAAVARQVLAVALDQVLRLLHPFVPFITETLWKHLNAQTPERGLTTPLPVTELLVQAPWPTAAESWRNPELEADVALMQEVVRELRNVRNKYNVAPRKNLTAKIKAPAEGVQRLELHHSHISSLGGLSDLEIGPAVERPPAAATRVVGEAELFVLGVLDPEKERARLGKQRDELVKQIGATEARLGNQQFTAKAPADVVEAARTRLEELKAELVRVNENLQALGTED
jgi:valyl-tRNA synthetase